MAALHLCGTQQNIPTDERAGIGEADQESEKKDQTSLGSGRGNALIPSEPPLDGPVFLSTDRMDGESEDSADGGEDEEVVGVQFDYYRFRSG